MKTGPDALGTAEHMFGSRKLENGTGRPRYHRNESGSAKHEKRNLTPSVPPKKSMGAQSMKTRPDAFSTAENESGRAKHENGTRRPRYRRKLVRERKR
jgi:hypothetical protein